MKKRTFVIITLLVFILASRGAAECAYFLAVDDAAGSGLAPAARAIIENTLAANGCAKAAAPGAPGAYTLTFHIEGLDTDKRLNVKGLVLAGGLSSATYLRAEADVSLEAVRDLATVFSERLTFSNRPRELFSGWYRARTIKKHAVEDAAQKLAIRFLRERALTDGKVSLPPRTAGNLLTEDVDVWPVLGGGFTGVGVHEAGHMINARLAGHDARIRRSDGRTFEAQADSVAGLSLLFAPRLGDDMQFPFPDALYDFGSVSTPAGEQYLDNQGQPVSGGRSDHALIAYSGILYQNLANEYLLTRWPDLIDRDDPFKKGMFFGNILVPAVYTVRGYSDNNSDLWQLQQDLGWDRWAVNAMVLAPLAVDSYRYYHPEKKKLRRWARIAKAVPLILVLAQ